MSKTHPIYAFSDASITIINEGVYYKLHRSLFEVASPTFISSLSLVAESEPETYSLPDSKSVKNEEFDILLGHLYHIDPIGKESSFFQLTTFLRLTSPKYFNFPSLQKAALEIWDDIYLKDPFEANYRRWKDVVKGLEVITEIGLNDRARGFYYALAVSTEDDIDDQNILNATPNESSNSTTKTPESTLPEQYRIRIHKLLEHMSEYFSNTVFQPPPAAHMACTDAIAGIWSEKVSIPALTGSVIPKSDILSRYIFPGNYKDYGDGEDAEVDVEEEELIMGVDKPIETLKILMRMDWEAMGVCDSCAETKRHEWRKEIRNVWNRIGGWLEQDI